MCYAISYAGECLMRLKQCRPSVDIHIMRLIKIINEKNGTIIILSISIAVLIAFFMFDPIGQDNEYHNFSDTMSGMFIPNMLNVLSNIPFLMVGVLGLVALKAEGRGALKILNANYYAYLALFLGAALVGIGSGYYHLWPSNETLVWDRIPMTIAFMGLFSVIISEFISIKLGRICLIPFLCIGLASVLYWRFTEIWGEGDLRYYAVVQFFPILTIPVMLVFFKSNYSCRSGYWVLLATYVAAKLFETFDSQVHGFLGVISGHSIKHILPAMGLYYLIKVYRKREGVEQR